ncbi:type II toxin-antitoxin system HicA family toxin [Desulfallas thermosapovorans]|uniref:Putative RNA binding protein YcfA (HicA-like mRNA interferase family) n=1 Tax=Desulfallas thermosapovorans DSM 6562 TaxID=1121431 RepID=A0A5S4ZWI3_9FIRM|nr:type II toxin-antitoxin system HicA family toxin [Desulfallas thermosapovorans]TYO96576.1 putative RNA binding protein YcfA (HicA-like mRNA interferase family) [Desulfallas thermosapovorans DSM 6562]
MAKLPVLSGTQVVQLLSQFGFVKVAQKGSHVKLKGVRNGMSRIVIVPLHKELATGTLASILRQASLSIEELTGEEQ